jgi:hypothetical protein
MTKDGHRPITLPEHKRRAYSKGFEAELRREAGLQGTALESRRIMEL